MPPGLGFNSVETSTHKHHLCYAWSFSLSWCRYGYSCFFSSLSYICLPVTPQFIMLLQHISTPRGAHLRSSLGARLAMHADRWFVATKLDLEQGPNDLSIRLGGTASLNQLLSCHCGIDKQQHERKAKYSQTKPLSSQNSQSWLLLHF